MSQTTTPPTSSSASSASSSSAVGRQAVDLLTQLIRIDTTNTGEPATTKGEREAAELVAGRLQAIGLEPQVFESAPRRTNVIVRVEGEDSSKPPLVVHQHLDVVPAVGNWTHPPFSGIEVDGVVWGRGAVDMKDQVAMVTAVVEDFHHRGIKPARDLILAFFADEENGGAYGSQWMVTNHPELFQGAKEAISEIGGFPAWFEGHKVFLVETAEKAIAWMRLTAHGTAGHGSFINHNNAVAKLITNLNRLEQHHFEPHLTNTMQDFLTQLGQITGHTFNLEDPQSISDWLEQAGDVGIVLAAALGTHLNLTSLDAGQKANVIPPTASATIDLRPLPAQRQAAWKTIKQLLDPDIKIDRLNDHIGMESPDHGPIFQAMSASLTRNQTDVPVLPVMVPGGTDNKALARLGIHGYGFTPLDLPADFQFWQMFHNVNERVPASALHSGTQTLTHFFTTY